MLLRSQQVSKVRNKLCQRHVSIRIFFHISLVLTKAYHWTCYETRDAIHSSEPMETI